MQRNTSVWANAFLSSTKSPEVLCGFGDYIIVQFNNNSPFQLISDAYVQKAAKPPTHSCFPSLTVHLEFVCVCIGVRIRERKKSVEEWEKNPKSRFIYISNSLRGLELLLSSLFKCAKRFTALVIANLHRVLLLFCAIELRFWDNSNSARYNFFLINAYFNKLYFFN